MLNIEPGPRQQMIDDAIRTFPDECCGFMFGSEHAEGRLVEAMSVVDNSKPGDKTRRFEIAPLDYLRAEQYALDNNLLLLGVYHSHPKHPAIPSEHDLVAAQPWFSYLIISVLSPEEIMLRSWRLNESSKFEEESVNTVQLTT